MFGSPNLFVTQALDNPNASINISFAGNGDSDPGLSVTGFWMDEALTLDGSSSFEEGGPLNGKNAEDVAKLGADALGAGAGKLWDKISHNSKWGRAIHGKIAEVANTIKDTLIQAAGLKGIKLLQSTIAEWSGCTKPTFNFQILLVALKPGQSPLKDAVGLLRRCLPNAWVADLIGPPSAYSGLLGAVLPGANDMQNAMQADSKKEISLAETASKIGSTTPDNVSLSSIDSGVQGTCTISIGDWFRASNLLLTNVSFQVSTTVQKGSQKPLYCTGSITAVPYRDISEKDFAAYFPGLSGGGSSPNSKSGDKILENGQNLLNSVTGSEAGQAMGNAVQAAGDTASQAASAAKPALEAATERAKDVVNNIPSPTSAAYVRRMPIKRTGTRGRY